MFTETASGILAGAWHQFQPGPGHAACIAGSAANLLVCGKMLCHEYKCIFVHIPRTGGQSIERVFLDLLGLTWATRSPLLLRQNSDPLLGPPRLAHLKAEEYISCGYVSRDVFRSYFTFSFVRNPWERLVSIYKYRGYAAQLDFKTFLYKHFPHKHFPQQAWSNEYVHFMPQYDFIHNAEGKRVVDFVGRLETLQQDFNKICREIGLGPVTLPHVNKSSDPETLEALRQVLPDSAMMPDFARRAGNIHSHYTKYYDDDSREFVAKLYRDDIEAFGYGFDSS